MAVAYVHPGVPLGHSAARGTDVLWWRERLDAEARREWSGVLICLGVGVTLNALVLAGVWALAEVEANLRHGGPRDSLLRPACLIAAAVCASTLLVAAITKPAGRAERARDVLDRGMVRHGATPMESAALALIMLVALYGSYALVEAVRRTVMLCRLASVDRYEVARVMAQICASPAGVRADALLKAGQSERSLRGPIAALVLSGWVKIIDARGTLVQQSSSMRRLLRRHPLADVFHPGQ